jgi:hypothetical protein
MQRHAGGQVIQAFDLSRDESLDMPGSEAGDLGLERRRRLSNLPSGIDRARNRVQSECHPKQAEAPGHQPVSNAAVTKGDSNGRPRAHVSLFKNLVGAEQKFFGDLEVDRFRRLEVQHEIYFIGHFDR